MKILSPQFILAAALAMVGRAQSNAPSPMATATPVSTVTGKVVDDAGRPVQQATVQLEIRPANKASHPTPFNSWAKTANTGQFQFSNVPYGHFSVCAQVPHSGLLDPCVWDLSPPSLDVAGASVTVPTIFLRRGFALRVRLDDPKEQLASSVPQVKPPAGAPVMLGVWKPGGGFVPFTLRYQDKYGQEFEALVPYRAPLKVALQSRKLALSDNHSAAVDAKQGTAVALTILPGKEPPMLRFTVH